MCAVVVVLCTLPSQSRLIGMNTNALERLGVRAMDTLGAQEYREGSSSVRLEMWAASARLLQANWASGVGAGAWEAEIPTYQVVKGSAEVDPYAHNEYLQMLCEYGVIVGGTILAFSMAWLARSIAKVWAGSGLTDPQFGQPIFATISACALSTVAAVGFPFHLAPCTALLGIVMALAGHSGATVTNLRSTRFATAILTIVLSFALVMSLVIAGAAAYTERMYVLATAELIRAVNAPSERVERVASAKQRLSLAQSIQPSYPKLLLPAATVLIELGEWQAAKTAMQALAIARPQVADYWFSLAVLCAKLGEFPDSEYALNRLEALQPNGVRNVKARIDLLMRMQQYAQAKDVLQQYLLKWPSNTPIEPGLDLLAQKLNQY